MDGMMNGMMDVMMSGNGTDWGSSGGLGGLFGGGQMFLMGIVPLLVIGVIIWLVVESIRRNDVSRQTTATVLPPYPSGAAGSERTALRILDERYAGGEIEREEYIQRRADLGT